MICAETLRSKVLYDKSTGIFVWINSARSGWNGKTAGSKHHHGYISIKIDGQRYEAHRLAWLYCNGSWPKKHIDHINGVRDDNRVSNLREVTRGENKQNLRKAYKQNKCGVLGVCWMKPNRKWLAQIRVNGVQHYLGLHKTIEAARSAYMAAKKKLHPFSEITK